MNGKRIYSIHFIYGAISNITNVGLPVYYILIGLSPLEIGILISANFLGVIFLPIVGMVTDKIKRPRLVLQFMMFLFALSTFMIMISNTMLQMLIFVVILSLARAAMFNLGELVLLDHTKHNKDVNYGMVRSGTSLGYGVGVFLLIPFFALGPPSSFLVMSTIGAIYALIQLFYIEDMRYEESKLSENRRNVFKELYSNKEYLILIWFRIFVRAVITLKVSYQAILFDSLGFGIVLIAICNLTQILPELIILPGHDKYLKKYGFTNLMYLTMIIITIQVALLIVVKNPIGLIFVSLLHGVAMGIYLPTYSKGMKSILNEKVLASGYLFSATICSLIIFLISLLFITPIYSNLGVVYVYKVVLIISLLSFVPLSVLKLRKTKINLM